MFRRSGLLLGTLLAALIGTGCSNPGQYVDRPNAGNGSNNPIRAVNTSGQPLGTNTSGDTSDQLFDGDISITYYTGVNATDQLQDIRIARHKTDKKILRIKAPKLNDGQAVCLITGVQFSSDPYGLGSFFLDIGEQRCGSVPNGEGTFTMVRDDFNVVTVILQNDLDAFNYWATDANAPANSYPTMSQGIIDDLMPFPNL